MDGSPPLARHSGYLEHDGERIYVERVGSGEPPLVLCHGAGGNHAVWFQQVPVFARRRQVVCWDQRGFGRSTDRAGRAGPEAAVADLRALVATLGSDRIDLVGQSMGGWAALGFTLDEPARVRRLVLADTLAGIHTPDIEQQQRALQQRSGAALAAAATLGQHPALDPGLAERDPARAYLYQLLGGFGEPPLERLIPRLLAARRDAAELQQLTLPILCVVGAQDPLFPPALVRQAAALLPGARVVEIAGCGHSPYFEAPAQWNRVVADFLEATAPG